MELYLNNVGIIKESNVLLDGLTVITGKNSSGKTTVGKVMYSLLSAGSDLVEAFEESKRVYLCSQLDKVEETLKIRRFINAHAREGYGQNTPEGLLYFVAMRGYRRYDVENLTLLLIAMRDLIKELTLESYQEYLLSKNIKNVYRGESFISSLQENFSIWHAKSLEICEMTLELIEDENALYNFLKDRTNAVLNHEFNGQIRPIKYPNYVSKIELRNNSECIVKAKVKTEKNVSYAQESSFIYPFERCIFIDNPFVIDKLDNLDDLYRPAFRTVAERNSKTMITSKSIKDHDELLKQLLISGEQKNYFDELELQNKYRAVFERINDIVPGEFAKTSDGYFYVQKGVPLSVRNLATGSKMFFIVKKLLLNGLIDHNTMLILDEPESHLHPEWINKFAEILVLLVKNVKVNVLLTTHSPNLMLALNVYARKMDLNDEAHFYLAEQGEDRYFSNIRCIDESIGEGYSHLSIPLVEMNLELEELNGE